MYLNLKDLDKAHISNPRRSHFPHKGMSTFLEICSKPNLFVHYIGKSLYTAFVS